MGVGGHSFPRARHFKMDRGPEVPISAILTKSSSVMMEGTQSQETNCLAIVTEGQVLKKIKCKKRIMRVQQYKPEDIYEDYATV